MATLSTYFDVCGEPAQLFHLLGRGRSSRGQRLLAAARGEGERGHRALPQRGLRRQRPRRVRCLLHRAAQKPLHHTASVDQIFKSFWSKASNHNWVTHLLGINLPLTRIYDVPPSCQADVATLTAYQLLGTV